MIRVIVISIICLAAAMATTTVKHTHPTREPSEHDTFKFVYEPHTHMMLLVSGNTCYIFTLTDAERLSVHSDTGIAALELKLLSSLTTATMTTPSEDQLDRNLRHACGAHITTYYTATV